MKKRLTTLNFVRAAACLGVFTFHCYISLLGAWAVSVFVILSGFLLTYNSIDRVDSFPRGVKGCAKYSFKKIKKLYNPALQLTGILLTMYNGRLILTTQVVAELKKYYAGKIFSTTILRNVRLSEAPSYGMPIRYYDKYSKGCQAYDEVAKEILERL